MGAVAPAGPDEGAGDGGLLTQEVAAGARPDRVRSGPGTLHLGLLGPCRCVLDGEPLHLTRRQLEVLALLALSPGGLTADAPHDALYGEPPVSRSTLKAEVSHLRALLGGAVGSRPYRLLLPVRTDVDLVRRRIAAGDAAGAVEAWGAPSWAASAAPTPPSCAVWTPSSAPGVRLQRRGVRRGVRFLIRSRLLTDEEEALPEVVAGG